MSPDISASYARKSIVNRLVRVVTDYFKDAEHQKEFKKWHLETYGEPYEFKRMEVK